MQQLTNWSPKTNMTDGISKTVEWYKEFFQDRTPESLTL
jgi:dTDP-D-glucose 4,6-dehydratase